MQKYKDIDGDIIKLKLFPFSLRGKDKQWLLSLPRNSIDSSIKCKDAFIGKYYPPAKIISMRSEIMKFKQLDNEHVAQAWERMKSLVKNCPTHGLTSIPRKVEDSWEPIINMQMNDFDLKASCDIGSSVSIMP